MPTVVERVVDQALLEETLDMNVALAPLVLGVTGHRDLREEDLPQLKSAVTRVLSDLKTTYRATPFILISGLAEGADRLVARAALNMGAQLVVPLPLPRATYENDFKDTDSLDEFRTLLGEASYWFEIPLPRNHPGGDIQTSTRNLQYEEMGKFIARQSQIVIALWDGIYNQRVGGTGAVVKFQTQGVQSDGNDDLQPLELFPVYHIITPRQSNPSPPGEAFKIIKIYPSAFELEQDADRYYERLFRNLDDFNSAIMEGGASLRTKAVRSKEQIMSDPELSLLSRMEIWILERYAVADALAIDFQRRLLRAHRMLHWFVFAAFLLFVLFAHFPGLEGAPVVLLGALLILSLAVGNYRRARGTGLDDKCLDYRAIAEGCRVTLFWHISDLDESIADNYLGQQRTELDWIRNGFRGWHIGPRQKHSPKDAGTRLNLALKNWVEKQRDWFQTKVQIEKRKLEQMELLVHHLVIAGLGVATGVVLTSGIHQFMHHQWCAGPECEWIPWCIIVTDLCLASGALLHHANQRMARPEHIKQYKRMHSIFQNASGILHERIETGDMIGGRHCVKKLGQEALAENANWVLLHRERPLELPHP